MLTYNTLVVLAGASLLGLLCGIVGSFAVLRRRALLGDVLAHATLPGLALAFLIASSKSLPVLLAGALGGGLFGLGCLSYLRKHTRTKDDAAMGIVLAVMFGAGIALSRYVQNVSKDASHAGLDSFILGKTAGMVLSDVLLTSGVCLAAIITIFLMFKEFEVVCFDTGFAQSLGWRVQLIDFLILTLLALAVVVGLPMVGVVMVAALTIIPPVAARLWTNALHTMLILAAIFGIVSAASGVLISASADKLPSGPLIVLCASVLFVFSALFAPNRGLIAIYRKRKALQEKYGLMTLYKLLPEGASEIHGSLRAAGVLRPRRVLADAISTGVAKREGDRYVAGKLAIEEEV